MMGSGAWTKLQSLMRTEPRHLTMIDAGGAVELAVAIIAMQQDLVPPTAHCRVPDWDLGIDMVAEGPRHQALTTVMSNSFAFGCSNAVLIAHRLQI